MKQNKKGFTLLEIIIVIIIIGVLAALALPRFFKTIEFSRSTEALNAFTLFRGSMERCYLSFQTYEGCLFDSATPTTSNIDLEDPADSPNAHFTYAVSGQGLNGYIVTATRNTNEGGSTLSTITLTVAGNSITREGEGAFGSIR